MRIKRYKYLIRLIVIILLALTSTIIMIVSFFWTHSFEEIRKGNEVYYEKLTDSFMCNFTREIDNLRSHAAGISVDSRSVYSAFWVGTENYQKNAYWYLEAVDELKNRYSNHNASECGIYYYEIGSMITKNSKQTLDQFIRNTLQVSDDYAEGLQAFFSEENYQFMKLVYCTTNTDESADGKLLVGYCTTMGKNKDKVMICYLIEPDDFLDMLNITYGTEGIWFYVLEKDTDQIYLAISPEGDEVQTIFPWEDEERTVSGTKQKVFYRKDSASLPLSFVIYLTDESLQNNIEEFYQDMKKMIFIMIFLVLGICVIALYVEYKPVYRILEELDEEGLDEFTMIQGALDNRQSIIKEQELLITDLLINHLIYGVPVSEEKLNKLGINASGGFYCVWLLIGHTLLTTEVEQIVQELERQLRVRLFVIDIPGENSNVMIAFLENEETNELEKWLHKWLGDHCNLGYKLYSGKMVKQINDIRSSFLYCYEKRKEYEDAQKAMKAAQEALKLKEAQQEKMKEDILAYLEIHYRDVDLSQIQIADAFQISNYTLSRMFKKQIGVGFTEYVNFKRLEYAKELLLTTTYSIHEISFMAGFANDNYFSRIFKINVGVSPTVFRGK